MGFWEDSWLGGVALKHGKKDRFPTLFKLSAAHDKPISRFCTLDFLFLGGSQSWNLQVQRNLNERKVMQAINLLSLLDFGLI